MKHIVFIFSAQHTDGVLQFVFPSYQRITVVEIVIDADNKRFPLFPIVVRKFSAENFVFQKIG